MEAGLKLDKGERAFWKTMMTIGRPIKKINVFKIKLHDQMMPYGIRSVPAVN